MGETTYRLFIDHIRLSAYYSVPFQNHNHGIIDNSATTSDSVNLNYTAPAQTVELEFPFTLAAANLNNNDTIEVKAVKSDGSDLTTYTNTPTVTVAKTGGTQSYTCTASGGAIAGGETEKVKSASHQPTAGAIAGGDATKSILVLFNAQNGALAGGAATAGDRLSGRVSPGTSNPAPALCYVCRGRGPPTPGWI